MPTHYSGTAEETRALDAWIKLSRAADAFGARLAQHGALGDLTISQFGALEALLHLGPLRQGEIGAKLLRSGSDITMVIDNLERRGLVTRQRDPADRRAVIVTLTEAGRSRIEGVFPCHVAAVVEAMSVLAPDEQEMLGRLCKKLGRASKRPLPAQPGNAVGEPSG
jgi:MarR family 2-MHQ and catechol resistance regulon transcriptional repressor